MTPSEQAKAAGLKSLRHMAQITETPESTLYDMAKRYPKRFECLCIGAGNISTQIPNCTSRLVW